MANAPILSLLALGAGLVAFAPDASAQRIRVSGGVRIEARAHVRIGTPPPRVIYRPRRTVRFAQPPPPPVPSYYVGYEDPYYVEPPPPPIVVAPPMRRWALGLYAGSAADDAERSADMGLLARYRLTRSLELEGELSRAEGDFVGENRAGVGLLYNLAARRTLSPYILGAAGVGQSTTVDGDEFGSSYGYAEVGVGLQYRVSRGLHLIGDLRAGVRDRSEDVAYISPVEPEADSDGFTRARLAALYFF